MTCVEYLCGAMNNIYFILEVYKADLKSFGDGTCTYPLSYRPELEVTDELDEYLANRFQQIIGFLRL